ncbi:MAG: hypothetical protein LBT53_07290 [Puniceicoccales bacterium]|nr:hypothetical protein [Puniceicoccales bacterium]
MTRASRPCFRCSTYVVSPVAPKKTLRNLNALRTFRAFIKLPSAPK